MYFILCILFLLFVIHGNIAYNLHYFKQGFFFHLKFSCRYYRSPHSCSVVHGIQCSSNDSEWIVGCRFPGKLLMMSLCQTHFFFTVFVFSWWNKLNDLFIAYLIKGIMRQSNNPYSLFWGSCNELVICFPIIYAFFSFKPYSSWDLITIHDFKLDSQLTYKHSLFPKFSNYFTT